MLGASDRDRALVVLSDSPTYGDQDESPDHAGFHTCQFRTKVQEGMTVQHRFRMPSYSPPVFLSDGLVPIAPSQG